MNDVLLEMLAARTGNSNPMLTDMLARMRSSSDGGQLSPELLAQLGNTNPTAALLAKHLAESRANGAASKAVIDVEAEEVPTQGDADSADAMGELRERVESMFAELNAVRERLDLLASALGACSVCWGEDGQCRICRGRGRPGFAIPDETLFEEFVLPAIRTLRAQRAKSKLYAGSMER
jgi:hypothetical protein